MREKMEKLEIRLQRAPDDPKLADPKFQEELRGFSKALRSAGIDYSQRAMAFDAADGLGYPLPEFLIAFSAPIAALAALCGAWVQGRYGRKVRIKISDVEAEARTIEAIEHLLKRAQAFREKPLVNDGQPGAEKQ
jgi:hypothetical protein